MNIYKKCIITYLNEGGIIQSIGVKESSGKINYYPASKMKIKCTTEMIRDSTTRLIYRKCTCSAQIER